LKGPRIAGARIKLFDLSLSNKVTAELVSVVKQLDTCPDWKEQGAVSALIEAIEKFSGKYKNREGLHLFLGNLAGNLVEEEPTFHQQLLCESLVALSTLQKHGTFICRTHRAIRFSEVGIIRVLFLYFEKIYFIKPFTSSPISSERFLVCQHMTARPPDALLQFLNSVNTHFLGLEKGRDILEVLPPPVCVNSKSMREALMSANSEITLREVYALECIEKGTKKYTEEEIGEKVRKILGEM